MDIDGNTHKSYKTLKERLINQRIKGFCWKQRVGACGVQVVSVCCFSCLFLKDEEEHHEQNQKIHDYVLYVFCCALIVFWF
jgi:hypothetical protein